MNLNEHTKFTQIDRQDMMGQIEGLPDQLNSAWELGSNQELPPWKRIQQVLIAGMGGSAIGADLLAAYVASSCRVPVVVHRDYGVPAWAVGPETLFVGSSHSGNTEETLSAFEDALNNRCSIITVSTGGKLAQAAAENSVPLWRFDHSGQPRAAVGYSFGLLLSLFARMELIPDPFEELQNAIDVMRQQQSQLASAVPDVQNLAKRLAGQIMGRWVTVIGSGVLAPVARRWKGQVSEIGKAWSQFEFLPEADHNTLAGVENPEEALAKTTVLFLRSPSDHPRNRIRTELTRRVFMVEGMGTDIVDAAGETPLANQWASLHLGDYVAYYLAMAYGVDPTPVNAIEGFKRNLAQSN